MVIHEYERFKDEYNKLLNQKAEEIIYNQEFREFVKESLKDLVRDLIIESVDDITYDLIDELERKTTCELTKREIDMIVDQLPKKLLDEFKKINMIEALKQIIYDAL
jgi:hypothetical protein